VEAFWRGLEAGFAKKSSEVVLVGWLDADGVD
jgi:hypothetical protein